MNAAAAVFLQPEEHDRAALAWLRDASALSAEKVGAPWVAALRETGAEAFAAQGIPGPRDEGWQYTHLRGLGDTSFRYSAAPAVFSEKDLPPPLLENAAGRVVVVNGQYQPQLSRLPAGVMIQSLMQAASDGVEGLEQHLVPAGDLGASPFRALNAAYLRDGFVLRTEAGRCVERPVEVLFYAQGNDGSAERSVYYPRVLYWIGQGSRLSLIEHHAGRGASLTVGDAHAALESSARLDFHRYGDQADVAAAILNMTIQQEKSSSFEGFSLATGGALIREEFQFRLIDSGISSSISGVYLLRHRQCHDFTLLMDHFEPDGKSVQHFKGVIDDQARAVFQGKIHVRRSAQKTDGYQSHHALLLSREAEASAKPELEIYADDVKCSHGATSGQIDPQALFYMRSRGIPENEARSLLIKSFLEEAFAHVQDAEIRAVCAARAEAWLGAQCRK